MHDPQEGHPKVVKRNLHYLVGSTNHGLFICCNTTTSIIDFSDVDWSYDIDNRISTTRYCVFFLETILYFQNLINRRRFPRASRRLNIVALLHSLLKLYGFTLFFKNFTSKLPFLSFTQNTLA